MSSVPVVFMHIPKTAGTALITALTSALAPREVVSGFDRVLFGKFTDFDTVEPELRRSIHLDAMSLPPNGDFVSGHISLSTLLHSYGAAQFITALREPVSRLLSHWLYWRNETDERLRQWGRWGEVVSRHRGPLRDFLANKEIACQTDNLSVRILLWPNALIPEGDFIDSRNDETLIEAALSQLERFAYVDIVENPKFAADLQDWLGRGVNYRTVNATKNILAAARPSLQEELNAEAFRLMELRTRLDLKLWKAVAEQRSGSTNLEWLRLRTVMLNAVRYTEVESLPSRRKS